MASVIGHREGRGSVVKCSILLAGLVMAASTAQAAEAVMQLADNTPAAPRFMSLDSARDGTAQARGKAALRSDRASMQSGFMRIDRARSVPIRTQRAVASAPSESRSAVADVAPLIIRGTGTSSVPGGSVAPVTAASSEDPVLDLFNAAGDAPVSSFRDAMRKGAGTIPTTGVAAAKQHWPLPFAAKQEISSGYGMRKDPFHGQPAFHGGVDIAADVGTPVLATAEAVVSKVGQDARYGKFIQLTQAGGIELYYGHLNSQAVREGDRVRAGQTIGTVGSTGRSTGPHLDYRVSLRGTKIDPMAVLTPPPAVAAGSNKVASSSAGQTGVRTASARVLRPGLRSEMQVKVIAVD